LENIKHIEIPSKNGKGTLKNINQVMDCWFESGCVPFAQYHYPFENMFSGDDFLVDYIVEGLDQTRGWFYTLMVIATALSEDDIIIPPAKVIGTTGLILDENGHKYSKSKNNYSDPIELLDKYGADVVRLYLLSSPATHAEPLLFSEK